MTLERTYAATGRPGHRHLAGVQSFINMGVNMGLLPTKGLTLPLMSFGGSGILANCVALAILLRIDWGNRQSSCAGGMTAVSMPTSRWSAAVKRLVAASIYPDGHGGRHWRHHVCAMAAPCDRGWKVDRGWAIPEGMEAHRAGQRL